MQPLAIYYDLEEALVVRSLLEAHDITAYLADINMLSVSPMDRVSLGGSRLFVLPTQIEQARLVINSAKAEAHTSAQRCNRCNSPNLRAVRGLLFPLLHYLLIDILPFAGRTRFVRCQSCHRKQLRD